MPRILTKLRIDEVSAVDRGAGEGVKIVLMKRNQDGAAPLGKGPPERRERWDLRKHSFNEVFARMEKADDGNVGGSDHHASKIADLMVEARSFPDRATALRHLLHSRDGQSLLARMSKAVEQIAKDHPMTSHTEFVRDVVKRYGVTALCKSMVGDQKSYGLTEHELVGLITEEAQAAFPQLTKAQAFAELYKTESVWRACAIAHAAPFVSAPAVVGGLDAMHEAIDDTENSAVLAAYNELLRRAAEYRKANPALSEAQSFDAVFTSKENADLAAKAHRRPSPPANGMYAFPR